MITPLLKHALTPVVARQRNLRYLRSMAAWLAGFAALALFLYLLRGQFSVPPVLLFIALFIVARVLARRTNKWEPDYHRIAESVERTHPELHALLLTAVEQRPDAQGRFGFLQQRVIQETVAASRKAQWVDSVPTWRLWSWGGAVGALVVVVSVLSYQAIKEHVPAAARIAEKSGEAVTVTPGDATVERGSGLIVLAKFNRNIPSEAVLVATPRNQPPQRIPLVRNLDDPVFGGGLPEVDGDLSYRVEFAGEVTRDFTVKVFEHPRLERADATLRFPDYTKLEEKKIPDTRRVTAVEGTKLAVDFQLNKPVQSAALVSKDGKEIPLEVDPAKAAAVRDLPVEGSQTYEVRLKDADGRGSKVPAQFIVEATPNRPPEIKIATPKGDKRVTPIEEMAFRAEVWDDFGLARYGITYTVAGKDAKDVEFGREIKGDERQQVAHLLKLEELGMQPDELISWFMWAEDTGPDGQLRRTATDMYFAEVKPFEEIYRPGESQEGGGGGGAGAEATKLSALQKQIITATWNLQRAEQRNPPEKPSEKYLADEPVVRDSQGEALKQAEEMAKDIEDPKSQTLVENVAKEMQRAVDQLTAASKTTAPLPDALSAEQAAYNALLKLAAHEYRISRSKGKGQGGQRNQQEMDQLELKEEEKRYETKSEAEKMQNEQQREQLAILNRLKELAQRQNDINERVKELQTALQEAKTEEQKEDLRRQLQRLREEQQQMLADLDEAQQKMQQAQQQSQFSEERKQLEQTRSEAQEAAEAMERQQASQALASGTRAARNLEDLRDEFRKKTSRRFNDEMREMRTDARALAEKQEELANQLKPATQKPERRTLDGSSQREQIAQQLEKQQGALAELTEDMKRVSEQAEAAEPLLAKELYDTLRKSTQVATGETLEKTSILAQRGLNEQARQFEEKARAEINELKSGVERAAEAVLGDEAEALRQARAELDALTEQLNQEIARARPDLAQAGTAAQQPHDPQSPDGAAAGAAQNQAGGEPTERQGADRALGENPARDPSQRTPGMAPGQDPSGAQTEPRPGESGKPAPGDGQQAPGEKAEPTPAASSQQPGGQKPGEQSDGKQSGGEQPGGQEPGQQPGGQLPGGQQGPQTVQSGSQPGGQQSGAQAQGAGQQPEQSPSQQPGQGRGQGAGQSGQTAQSAQPQDGQPPGAQSPSGQEGSQPGSQSGQGGGTRSRLAELADVNRQSGRTRSGGNEGGARGGPIDGENAGPLTGERFVEWSDRLRNVEEMIDNSSLRTDVARVREVAKGVRAEFKRHSVEPNWDLVQMKIGSPLLDLRNRLTEELARRESKENLVPIDRDPVPSKYAERVRRYYEELGRSR